MIHGYSGDQIREAERPHLEAGEPLMRRAAAGLAREIRAVLAARGAGTRRILVLAGSGDNGGDALFAAAELAAEGADVRVVTTGRRVHEEAFAAALAAGADVSARTAEPGSDVFEAATADVDVIVDGILGIGSTPDPSLRGRAREVVAALRPRVLQRIAGAPSVVAVDIPSGIGSDDGSVPDPLVLPAQVTVTFGARKAGLLLPPASGLAGRVVLVDIGLQPDLDGVRPVVSVDDRPEAERS